MQLISLLKRGAGNQCIEAEHKLNKANFLAFANLA